MSFAIRFTEHAEADLIRLLFEIEDNHTITILAVRHQREDDYHL